MPTISVIMPVYNGERYLREAMESIFLQTYVDWELICIDDGSTDATAAIVASYSDHRLRFFRNDINLGIIRSLNRAIALAQAKYIARMDADDIAEPHRLARQFEIMEQNPVIAVLGSKTLLINDQGEGMSVESYPETTEDIMRTIFVHNPFAHASVMIRTSVLKECGNYDARFLHNEDYDLWLRIGSKYTMNNCSEVLLKRRVHNESITVARETEVVEYRIKTIYNAVMHYYHRPLLLFHVIRPSLAYAYRVIKGMITP